MCRKLSQLTEKGPQLYSRTWRYYTAEPLEAYNIPGFGLGIADFFFFFFFSVIRPVYVYVNHFFHFLCSYKLVRTI